MVSEYGESRALVEMDTIGSAKSAIEGLNGKVKMEGSKVFLGLKMSGIVGRNDDGFASKRAKTQSPQPTKGTEVGKGKGTKGGKGSNGKGGKGTIGKGAQAGKGGGKGKGAANSGAFGGRSPTFMGQRSRQGQSMQQPMVYVPMMPNMMGSPLPMMMPQMMQPQMQMMPQQQVQRMAAQQSPRNSSGKGGKKVGLNYGPMDMSLPGSRGYQGMTIPGLPPSAVVPKNFSHLYK